MRSFSIFELETVFDWVWQDIKAKNRQKKSVVTYSASSLRPVDPNNLSEVHQRQREQIATLLRNDVPVVVSAGNDADKDDSKGNKRVVVDTVPAIFEGPDYPLVVVGATDFTGKPADFSQGGDKVKILGPGVDIKCQDRAANRPETKSGTSFRKFILLMS